MGNGARISVDIVIPQYKHTWLLERCLTSLFANQLPRDVNYIWVVENGGEYGAITIVDRFSETYPVKYLYQEEGNLSKARNLAAAKSTADYLIFFDNDMRFNDRTVPAYCKAFETFGSQFFYGGPLVPDYETPPPEWLVRYLPYSAKGFSLGNVTTTVEQPVFLGGNHGVHREMLLKLGGYDEGGASGSNSGFLGEETRLQLRMLQQGKLGVYVSDAVVWHLVPEENCNTRWTIQRAYRNGLTEASEMKGYNRRRTFLDVPLFFYRRLLVNLVASAFRPGYGYWFRIRYLLSHFKGLSTYFKDK